MSERVVGANASKKGWVAVVLSGGQFRNALTAKDTEALLGEVGDVEVIAVDVPIGLDGPYPRPADEAARDFVRVRRPNIFDVPPRAVLETWPYEAARQLLRELEGAGLTKHAYGIRKRILEIDKLARDDPRVIEVHPEVSYRELSGNMLEYSKHTWGGLKSRENLLAGAGIVLPADLRDVGLVDPTSIIDAAAAAWSAQRYLSGEASHIPAKTDPTERGVIWY